MCTYTTCDYYGKDGCAYERITSCIRPCKEGSYCHFKPVASRKQKGSFDKKAALALYKSGATDNQIAQALDLAVSSVSRWRRNLGLPFHVQRIPFIKHAKAYPLYEMGMTDRQIAQALNVSQTAIVNWRKKKGLTPNKLRKRSVANVV